MRITSVQPFEAGNVTPLPLLLCRVSAGFPSPADDYIEGVVDLNELAVRNPTSTFLMRVEGFSMVKAGIHDGDIIIVDRAIEPKDRCVVVAALMGELTIKRIQFLGDRLYLMPENDEYPSIPVTEEMSFEVWGVVTGCYHTVR